MMASKQAVLKLSGTGNIWHRIWYLVTEATPAVSMTKTFPGKPSTPLYLITLMLASADSAVTISPAFWKQLLYTRAYKGGGRLLVLYYLKTLTECLHTVFVAMCSCSTVCMSLGNWIQA